MREVNLSGIPPGTFTPEQLHILNQSTASIWVGSSMLGALIATILTFTIPSIALTTGLLLTLAIMFGMLHWRRKLRNQLYARLSQGA